MPSAFHHLDRLRRHSGQWLDNAGLGPEEYPHACLWESAGGRLLAYRAPPGARHGLLIVPAPIKRHYIWDLHPAASVVGHALGRGFAVYLAEWTEAPEDYGLAEYAAVIARCVATVTARQGRPPHLATHSLGGVLCVAYAALHPGSLAALVLVETPLHFGGAAGAFQLLLAAAPPAAAIAARFGCVPGSFLGAVSVAAAPAEFGWQRYADFVAATLKPAEMRTHLLVERWTLDELPLPGKLYLEVVDDLYRGDRLMRGDLLVAGTPVSPAAITAPLVAVFNPRSWVIPPESIIPFYRQVASTNKRLLPYEGDVGVALQHVGALVGRHAHAELWPAIFGWLREAQPL